MSVPLVERRSLLRASWCTAAVSALGIRSSFAQSGTNPADEAQAFSGALLRVMRAGRGTPFAQRYAMLAPAVDRMFDLDSILRSSVGTQWASMSPDQQATLRDVFRRYTVANFVANFDTPGETIRVNPEPRSLPNGDQIVTTQIIRSNGSPVVLAYVMRQAPSGWKAVDVLADGSISRVATQRSDFRGVLASGGVPALVQRLQDKTASLSG